MLLLSQNISVFSQVYKAERMVVATSVVGQSPEASDKKVAFFAAEVVTVLAKKVGHTLVRGDNDSGSAWIPTTSLVDAASFHPIWKWAGKRQFEISSASGDSGLVYQSS